METILQIIADKAKIEDPQVLNEVRNVLIQYVAQIDTIRFNEEMKRLGGVCKLCRETGILQ